MIAPRMRWRSLVAIIVGLQEHRVLHDIGVDIVAKPRRVERIQPDDHLAMPESPGAHGLCHLDARIRLGVGRDRVLEIENDAIDRQRFRFVDRAGVRARHVEHAAARADGHG